MYQIYIYVNIYGKREATIKLINISTHAFLTCLSFSADCLLLNKCVRTTDNIL